LHYFRPIFYLHELCIMLFDMNKPSPASISDFVANFENNIGNISHIYC
jgi:hypothetical protein